MEETPTAPTPRGPAELCQARLWLAHFRILPMQLTSRSHGCRTWRRHGTLLQGWTDGLPVVPPTEDRIAAMLAAVKLDPGHQVAFIENRQVSVTAEKIAINAVLAGCKPEYMPVVVAAAEALGDPLYGYHGPGTSTGGSGVLMIVNGPIARELDMNCGHNLFGPGWRANATIGRAVRLLMRNTIGTLPGTLDQSSLGHRQIHLYIRENEAESPWPPLHVSRGFKRTERGDHHGRTRRASVIKRALQRTGRHPHDRVRTMRVSRALRANRSTRWFRGEHMAVCQSRLDAR
jgi:hypothetical protein